MNDKYEGSSRLFPIDKATSGTLSLSGQKWYVRILSTGRERPSHELIMRNAETNNYVGTVLFRNDPDKASLVSGSIKIEKDYWVDIYQNEDRDGGPPYLTIKLKEKKPKADADQSFGDPPSGLLTYDDALAACFDNGIKKDELVMHLKAAGHESWSSAACTPLVRQLIDVVVKDRAASSGKLYDDPRPEPASALLDDEIPF